MKRGQLQIVIRFRKNYQIQRSSSDCSRTRSSLLFRLASGQLGLLSTLRSSAES